MSVSNTVFREIMYSLLDISENNLSSFKKNQKTILNKIKERPNNIELFTTLNDESHLEWIMLNSMFISMYSHFEKHLLVLADHCNKQDARIKLSDISGKGIEQYRKYLFLVHNINAADKSSKSAYHSKWQDILMYGKVRNKLVHSIDNAIVTDPSKLESDSIYKFLKKFNVSIAGSLGVIRIRDTEILKKFVQLSTELCDDLISNINKKVSNIG